MNRSETDIKYKIENLLEFEITKSTPDKSEVFSINSDLFRIISCEYMHNDLCILKRSL